MNTLIERLTIAAEIMEDMNGKADTIAATIREAAAALRAPAEPLRDAGAVPLRWAQGLIEQLPSDHDGRNSWLLNYGVGDEADWLRSEHATRKAEWAEWRPGQDMPERRRYPAPQQPDRIVLWSRGVEPNWYFLAERSKRPDINGVPVYETLDPITNVPTPPQQPAITDAMVELCREARKLQREHYGDGSGLHLAMIDWARKYDAAAQEGK